MILLIYLKPIQNDSDVFCKYLEHVWFIPGLNLLICRYSSFQLPFLLCIQLQIVGQMLSSGTECQNMLVECD